jgi:SAM-dependent methyltransferase
VKTVDKYDLYRRAVQSPDADVQFLQQAYRDSRGRKARVLREDFCGTFSICCEWAKLHREHRAFGVDVDQEPISYGVSHNLSALRPTERSRVTVLQADVLNPGLPHADIICAMNFSHFIFKDRSVMKSYFHNCLTTLNQDGVLIVDCFGGPACHSANRERNPKRGFTYIWEQTSFNPVTHEAQFDIHFKWKGGGLKKAFSYDWRLWSLPELKEMMLETGFRAVHVYWEGSTRSGEGNGVFKRSNQGEECLAWIAYVVGEK